MRAKSYLLHKTHWLLAILLAGVFVMASATGEAATLDKEHFVVGGIGLDSTPEYVESIYGAPNDVKYGRGPFGDITHWYYGDSFSIGFVDGVATYIDVTDNNGIKTVDGIQVGDTRAKVEQTYGRPTRFRYYSKQKRYESWYLMTGATRTYLIFTFDIHQKIIRYSIALVD